MYTQSQKKANSRVYVFRSSSSFAILVVATAAFTDTFLYDLILPIIPNILQDKLQISTAEVITWVSVLQATFGAAFLFTPMIIGAYFPHNDSKRSFLAGLIVLVIATFLFFLGSQISILVIARFLQGASAALIWTSGMDFLNIRVGPEAAGSAMSYFTMATSFGELLGPIFGGVVYDNSGQMAVFGIAAAVITVDGILRLLVVGEEVTEEAYNDPEATKTIQALMSDVDSLNVRSYGSVNLTPSLTEIDNESLEGEYTSNWSILTRDKDFMISFGAALLTSTTRSALETKLPIYVQTTFDWTPSGSGLIVLCLLAPSLLSPIISHITKHFGPRWISTISLFTLGTQFLIVGLGTGIPEGFFCVIIGAIGVSLFSAQVPHMLAFTVIANKKYNELEVGNLSKAGSRREEERNKQSTQVYAAMNVAFAAGLLVGPAWVGLIEGSFGWGTFCVSFGVAAILVAMLAAFSWRIWERMGTKTLRTERIED